jgi:signal transduction histidine kinase
MIRWIFNRNWLSIAILALTLGLFSAGIELVNSNFNGLWFSLALVIGVLFSRHFPWVSIAILPFGSYLLSFTAVPLVSLFFLSFAALLVSVFGSQSQRRFVVVSAILASLMVAWFVGYEGGYVQSLVSASVSLELARVNSLLLVGAAALLLLGFVMSFGRLAYLNLQHVGTSKDRAVQAISADRLKLEIAKQNERLKIAKDLSELLVQRVAAVVSVSEGGKYAIKADPQSGARALDRALESAREAQTELRRLHDYLTSSIFSELASFKIADLDNLMVAYREIGFNASLDEQGESFPLNEGMELCVYKIVFDSMENVKKHAPLGSDISVSFLWVEDGLQVLIKDNGIETSNRQKAALGELVVEYGAEDDFEALVSEFDGATLAALRDRAKIYNGRIEATKVPGVGFTLSAIFPDLQSLSVSK